MNISHNQAVDPTAVFLCQRCPCWWSHILWWLCYHHFRGRVFTLNFKSCGMPAITARVNFATLPILHHQNGYIGTNPCAPPISTSPEMTVKLPSSTLSAILALGSHSQSLLIISIHFVLSGKSVYSCLFTIWAVNSPSLHNFIANIQYPACAQFLVE